MINCFTDSGDSSFVKIPASQFKSGMLNLLKSETLSDVTLVVGRKKFKARRCILAARSPVFEAMFTLKMKEKNEESVNFPDVDSDVFYHMYYIYTSVSPDLKRFVTIENVSEMLTLADFHCPDQLKEIATSFMQKHFSKVQKTVG